VNLTLRQQHGLVVALLAIFAVSAGLAATLFQPDSASVIASQSSKASDVEPVFTPAHRSLPDALEDFFGVRRNPVQSIAFSHKAHLTEKIPCDMCHTAVAEGPQAGLPDVRICMSCHEMIATDLPEVQRVADYAHRGEDIPWQRVYGFSQSAHLKFNHAPHIRADIDCAKCHGDMTQQTVAVRAVHHTMGFCVDCHRAKSAPTECLTCHY
jgi:formylmethanofuran dehydrogenase subunit E